MRKILISACLVGEQVKYDGGDNRLSSTLIDQWSKENRLIPFCPEVAGGLSVPRAPVEIENGEGLDVLQGRSRAKNKTGEDVTEAFLVGAEKTLAEAGKHQITLAILKERSPSCGVNIIYNGRFNGTRVPGKGVTARLLEQNGIRTFSEDQLEEAAQLIDDNL